MFANVRDVILSRLKQGFDSPRERQLSFGALFFHIFCPASILSGTTNVFAVDLAKVVATGDLKSHATADVAVIKVGVLDGARFTAVEGVALKQLAATGIVGADAAKTTRKFDQVQISNDVYVFGYPNSI